MDTFIKQTAQNIHALSGRLPKVRIHSGSRLPKNTVQEADCLVPTVKVRCRSRKPTAVAPYVLEGFLRILDVSVLEMGEPLNDMRH